MDVLYTRDGLIGNSPRYAGYTTPPYKRYLKDDAGAVINLTNVTPQSLRLLMVSQSNPALVRAGGGAFSIISPVSQGLISYSFTDGDLADGGIWYLYITVQLPNEITPRVFDPELLSISMLPGGAVLTIQDVNIAQVNGLQLGAGNPVPVADIEQSGYIGLTTPPATTNAGSDTVLTFSSQVNRIIVQNNSSVVAYLDFDQAASTASFAILPGSLLMYAKKCTSPHLYTSTATPINAANGILLRGAL